MSDPNEEKPGTESVVEIKNEPKETREDQIDSSVVVGNSEVEQKVETERRKFKVLSYTCRGSVELINQNLLTAMLNETPLAVVLVNCPVNFAEAEINPRYRVCHLPDQPLAERIYIFVRDDGVVVDHGHFRSNVAELPGNPCHGVSHLYADIRLTVSSTRSEVHRLVATYHAADNVTSRRDDCHAKIQGQLMAVLSSPNQPITHICGELNLKGDTPHLFLEHWYYYEFSNYYYRFSNWITALPYEASKNARNEPVPNTKGTLYTNRAGMVRMIDAPRAPSSYVEGYLDGVNSAYVAEFWILTSELQQDSNSEVDRLGNALANVNI